MAERTRGSRVAGAEPLDTADDFADGTRADGSQTFPDFSSNAVKIGHHHFRITRKARPVFLILRGDTHGACIQVALAGHDAADGKQSGGAKAELIRAEKGGDDYVAADFESAVHAEAHAAAESGADQRAVGFAQAHFPGQPGIFDRCEWRCAGAAVKA